MKQIGLTLLVAGLALILAGVFHGSTPPPVIMVDLALHDTYYVVAHFHHFVVGGAAAVVLGGLLLGLGWRKGPPLQWLRGLGFGFLLAAAIATGLIYSQNSLMFDFIEDQGKVIDFVPTEPVSAAVFGLIGLVLVAVSGVLRMGAKVKSIRTEK